MMHRAKFFGDSDAEIGIHHKSNPPCRPCTCNPHNKGTIAQPLPCIPETWLHEVSRSQLHPQWTSGTSSSSRNSSSSLLRTSFHVRGPILGIPTSARTSTDLQAHGPHRVIIIVRYNQISSYHVLNPLIFLVVLSDQSVSLHLSPLRETHPRI